MVDLNAQVGLHILYTSPSYYVVDNVKGSTPDGLSRSEQD